jgi:hypothetical protein
MIMPTHGGSHLDVSTEQIEYTLDPARAVFAS